MGLDNSKKIKISTIIGIIGIIAGIIVIIGTIAIVFITPEYIQQTFVGFTVAIIFSITALIFSALLDRNKFLNKKFNLSIFNFRWVLIITTILAMILLISYIFMLIAGISIDNLNINMSDSAHIDAVYFLGGSLLFTGGILTIYLGTKNIKQKLPLNKIKLSLYALLSITLIVGIPNAVYFYNISLVNYSVTEKYLWNDGPWLTWSDDPATSMSISWLTKSRTETSLFIGDSPSNLIETTYNSEKSLIHHVNLTDLSPSTTYYYKINVDFSTDHETDVFNFTTASSINEYFKFIVVGDMQPTAVDTLLSGKIMAEGIKKQNPNFVVQVGDVSSTGGNILYQHNTLGNIAIYGSNAPFMSAIGNHDYGGDRGKNFGNIFPYNYSAPSLGDTGYYHSFDYQNAHLVLIDNFNNPSGGMTETQKLWVENDIQAAKSAGQDWIFLFFHHTILTTGTSGQNFDLQKWIIPLADAQDIDGVFFGHDHHYEHWNLTYGEESFGDLLYNETDNPQNNSVDYFCTGGGGAHLEIDYGLLTHDPMTETREWYNKTLGEYEDIADFRYKWNSSRYLDHTDNPEYGQLKDGKHYYHASDIEPFATHNERYGYDYGEQTLHYMLIEIDDNSCTISTHYPNGDLLQGPNDVYPQTWSYIK